MRRLVLVLGFLAGTAGALHAGAWTLPEGGWYVEETVSSFQTDTDFDKNGEKRKKDSNGVYTERAFKSYMEYGVANGWNLLVTLPYRRSHYVNDYNDMGNGGFQDLKVGVKYWWLSDPVVVSFAVSPSFPTGYNRGHPLPLGDARGNVEGRLFVSKDFNLWNGRLFLNGEVAKDRSGMPYYADLIHLPLPWLFTKFYLVGRKDLPAQPDGESFMQWNVGVGLTSEGTNAVMRSQRYKSVSLTLLYGQLFKGRNSGFGTNLTLVLALVF
jgi:hypothetical protein